MKRNGNVLNRKHFSRGRSMLRFILSVERIDNPPTIANANRARDVIAQGPEGIAEIGLLLSLIGNRQIVGYPHATDLIKVLEHGRTYARGAANWWMDEVKWLLESGDMGDSWWHDEEIRAAERMVAFLDRFSG